MTSSMGIVPPRGVRRRSELAPGVSCCATSAGGGPRKRCVSVGGDALDTRLQDLPQRCREFAILAPLAAGATPALTAAHRPGPSRNTSAPAAPTTAVSATDADVIAFLGHSDMRTSVMGLDRATRMDVRPTAAEQVRMAQMLTEALGAGFIGMFSQQLLSTRSTATPVVHARCRRHTPSATRFRRLSILLRRAHVFCSPVQTSATHRTSCRTPSSRWEYGGPG